LADLDWNRGIMRVRGSQSVGDAHIFRFTYPDEARTSPWPDLPIAVDTGADFLV
jgi:hypothetical protein